MNAFSFLDIRPRLLWLLLFSVLLFVPFKYFLTGGLALSLILLSLLFDGPRTTLVSFGRILPLLILVFLLTPLFYRTGEILWAVQGRTILTVSGLRETVRMMGRFAGVTFLFSLFFHSTEGDELVSGLRWYGLPFRGALVINLALRYIPEMFRLYDRVKDAHSLREQNDEKTGPLMNLFNRFSRVLPHLTSVLILSMKKIAPLSMALHLRGGNSGSGRTSMCPLIFNRKVFIQFAVYILITAGIVLMLVMNRSVWYKIAS